MQQSASSSPQQQQSGSTTTVSYTLPRDYVEQELADISQSNQRIREELEAAHSRGAFEEVPRAVFPSQEGSVSATTESIPGTMFGQRESSVKRIWGLEEQIKEDLRETQSIAPLPTRDPSYEATTPKPFETSVRPQQQQPEISAYPSEGQVGQQYGGETKEKTIGLGYEIGQQSPSVVVVSSIQFEEIAFAGPTYAAPEVREFGQQTQPTSVTEPTQQRPSSQPTTSTTTTTTPSASESKQYASRVFGLKSLDERIKPSKRVIDVFYDKNSMFTWNSNATVFAKWLSSAGILHEGDIVRHLTFSPHFQGVLHGRELSKNEDTLREMFPDQYPFWLEYFAFQIPFEIVFIKPDMQSLKNDIESYAPSLLLCPVMPEIQSPANYTIMRDISKVPVMFAH